MLSPCLLAFAHIDPELFTCVSWESCDKQPAHIVTPPLTLDSAAIIASVNRLCIVWIRAMFIVDTCNVHHWIRADSGMWQQHNPPNLGLTHNQEKATSFKMFQEQGNFIVCKLVLDKDMTRDS